MKKRWLHLLLTGVLSVTILSACGGSEETTGDTETEPEATETETTDTEEQATDQEQYVIGATQIVEHPSLDAAYQGFKDALADQGFVEGENVTYDFQNAQNDQNNTTTIANNFVAEGVDLIFANSTPSAQAALQASTDIPIVFTSVTDAVSAGLIEDIDTPSDLVTGVMDLHPDAIELTVDFIAEYFPGSSVGMVYNSGEQNSVSQIEAVEEAAADTDLEIITRSVSNSAEVQQATESLIGDADLIYIITDNTVVSALESVVDVANNQEMPLVVGEPDSLERGGFATFGIDYYTIGYRTGEMAAEILSGEKTPADIPVEYPEDMQLIINREAAEAQGVDIHEDWDAEAEFINE
ncbi:ABC transporter substrate-binding protein [Aliibacillus thermotolerans]|uniref:ABC transporter substrate-binding protein n=1 Tax=Aliibacillus thermotolerans TaxID=1834418 RepID=A0ABW0U520_9BACI|nr:ABC transporter substrate-binding protein [Aliibacillus thermotolerans]MDA3129206.1 BMP family ABC transporter substrate-binding protein [Aliibacillus thermotolerans]